MKGLEPSTFCMASGWSGPPSTEFHLQIMRIREHDLRVRVATMHAISWGCRWIPGTIPEREPGPPLDEAQDGDIEGGTARRAQSVSLASSWPVARVVPPGRKRSRPGRSAPRHRGRRRLTDGGELTRRPVRSVGGVAGADRRCGSRRCRRPPAGSAPSPPAHRPSTGRRQSAASRGRRTAEPFIYQATA